MFKKLIVIFLLFGFATTLKAQKNYTVLCNELLEQAKLNFLIDKIDYMELKKEVEMTQEADVFFNNIANRFFKEISYGHKPKYLQYESLSQSIDTMAIADAVNSIELPEQISKMMLKLEPQNPAYKVLRSSPFIDSLESLQSNLNFYRYLNRFGLSKYIIINVPSASLKVYHQNQAVLDMKVIVGRVSNQTPLMITYIDGVMTYPYWIPTRSIAINEILPKVKKDIEYLEQNNFEVLDSQGQVMNPSLIPWTTLNSSNFSYRFRQGTGCDNSLGLLKFNIVNPFSVYLHDTAHNKFNMSIFKQKDRFFSHGCIRLAKPVELANLLFEKPIFNNKFMEICLKNAQPQYQSLKNKMPVFIIYHTTELDEKGNVKTYKNVYNK